MPNINGLVEINQRFVSELQKAGINDNTEIEDLSTYLDQQNVTGGWEGLGNVVEFMSNTLNWGYMNSDKVHLVKNAYTSYQQLNTAYNTYRDQYKTEAAEIDQELQELKLNANIANIKGESEDQELQELKLQKEKLENANQSFFQRTNGTVKVVQEALRSQGNENKEIGLKILELKIAYRQGQLEKKNTQGLEAFNDKIQKLEVKHKSALDKIQCSFTHFTGYMIDVYAGLSPEQRKAFNTQLGQVTKQSARFFENVSAWAKADIPKQLKQIEQGYIYRLDKLKSKTTKDMVDVVQKLKGDIPLKDEHIVWLINSLNNPEEAREDLKQYNQNEPVPGNLKEFINAKIQYYTNLNQSLEDKEYNLENLESIFDIQKKIVKGEYVDMDFGIQYKKHLIDKIRTKRSQVKGEEEKQESEGDDVASIKEKQEALVAFSTALKRHNISLMTSIANDISDVANKIDISDVANKMDKNVLTEIKVSCQQLARKYSKKADRSIYESQKHIYLAAQTLFSDLPETLAKKPPSRLRVQCAKMFNRCKPYLEIVGKALVTVIAAYFANKLGLNRKIREAADFVQDFQADVESSRAELAEMSEVFNSIGNSLKTQDVEKKVNLKHQDKINMDRARCQGRGGNLVL